MNEMFVMADSHKEVYRFQKLRNIGIITDVHPVAFIKQFELVIFM